VLAVAAIPIGKAGRLSKKSMKKRLTPTQQPTQASVTPADSISQAQKDWDQESEDMLNPDHPSNADGAGMIFVGIGGFKPPPGKKYVP
jgi:hypothetical protein